MTKVYIIAEAGVNHNGSLELAYKLIDKACEAGVDAVKFQTFIAEKGLIEDAQKADYQLGTTDKNESQLEMIKKLELSFEDFKALKTYCDSKNIEFMSTGCDLESLDFLIDELGVQSLKISSGEIVNAPLLLKAAQSKKQIILSTGMSTIDDIETALAILEYGYTYSNKIPNSLEEVLMEFSGKEKPFVEMNVVLLHCTTEYPAPINELNLKVIPQLEKEFNTRVGYSDHSEGITASVIAVTLGATVVEKHFTLDKNMEGPDHKASLEPDELKKLASAIRETEIMLGSDKKYITKSEQRNVSIARKSLVAECEITKGELISQDKVSIKRPGTGLTPLKYWDIIGKKATKSYKRNEFIREV